MFQIKIFSLALQRFNSTLGYIIISIASKISLRNGVLLLTVHREGYVFCFKFVVVLVVLIKKTWRKQSKRRNFILALSSLLKSITVGKSHHIESTVKIRKS